MRKTYSTGSVQDNLNQQHLFNFEPSLIFSIEKGLHETLTKEVNGGSESRNVKLTTIQENCVI